jgi:hypothetical protein
MPLMAWRRRKEDNMNDLTQEQRAALAAGVDKVLIPLVRGVLVEKLSQVAAFMRDELKAAPPSHEWLKANAPEQWREWLAGNLKPATVDWMAGWDACRIYGSGVLASAGKTQAGNATPDAELPGMWERADFEGGKDEVRGPDWKRTAGDAGAVLSDEQIERAWESDGCPGQTGRELTPTMRAFARAILASAPHAAVPEAPKLICPRCHVDRTKAPCPQRWVDCAMVGIAQTRPLAAMHPTTAKEPK